MLLLLILVGVKASLIGRATEEGKEIVIPATIPSVSLRTDPILVTRVLRDMLVNALEVTGPKGTAYVFIGHRWKTQVGGLWASL